jgi:DNA-binding response OmpR family regulator
MWFVLAGEPYFVILTVLEEERHALAGMRAGADDCLTKPVDLDELRLRLIAAERVTTLHRRLAASHGGPAPLVRGRLERGPGAGPRRWPSCCATGCRRVW